MVTLLCSMFLPVYGERVMVTFSCSLLSFVFEGGRMVIVSAGAALVLEGILIHLASCSSASFVLLISPSKSCLVFISSGGQA